MTLQERWEDLTPETRKRVMLGVGGAGIFFLVALFVFQGPPPSTTQKPREAVVSNLLTDADPHALGLEGLANRMRDVEKRLTDMRKEAQQNQEAASPPTEQMLLQSQADMQRQVELEDLRQQLAEMRQELARRTGQGTQPPLAPVAPAAPQASPAPAPQPPEPARPKTLQQLFSPPPGAIAGAVGQGRQIRVIKAESSPGKQREQLAHDDEIYVPSGGILRGVLLNGLDAPTGQRARQDPMPALVRIKHDAILPNRFRADIRECFLLVGGFGDLSSERAYLRAETFSCVRTDGGVIDVPMEGYAVGEDGKVGLRGRLLSKQGAMLANAMQAGFLDSFSKIFNRVPSIPVSTDGNMRYNSVLTPESLQSGAAGGVSGAMERLADYYMDRAEEMYPVLEVDAGRGIEVILTKGSALRLR